MKKNLLNSYVSKLLESIEKQLSSYLKEKDPECLHKLRVEIKKIKAINSFARKIYERDFNSELLKPLFKKAGEIRETELTIQLLKSLSPSPNNLISKAESQKSELVLQFLSSGSEYFQAISEYRNELRFPEKLGDKKVIKEFFDKAKDNAQKILLGYDREGMHTYRRKIKNLVYIYDVLPKKLQEEIDLDKKLILKQQHQLGEWHDLYVAVQILSSLKISNGAQESIEKLKVGEEEQFRIVLEKIRSKFQL
ncbi:CHAD domain-containing protein [Algoriphagus limi]|uniref:CHAD domain-containing protein n=1 Tax=Algoriphagus limi TaxID=2975273 RepID=A0ABT2G3K8_9BACT|nr:CHAD domain-containing protein [Algoriphagus limi]MCS5489851.1 CHAD domain-containing protein [Algoriphagus limi]